MCDCQQLIRFFFIAGEPDQEFLNEFLLLHYLRQGEYVFVNVS